MPPPVEDDCPPPTPERSGSGPNSQVHDGNQTVQVNAALPRRERPHGAPRRTAVHGGTVLAARPPPKWDPGELRRVVCKGAHRLNDTPPPPPPLPSRAGAVPSHWSIEVYISAEGRGSVGGGTRARCRPVRVQRPARNTMRTTVGERPQCLGCAPNISRSFFQHTSGPAG